MGWLLFKTLLSLAAILALMFGLVKLLKRFFLQGQPGTSSLVEVEILGRRVLQPKCSVFVLRTLNRIIVVGVTDQGIQSLAEIDDAESVTGAGEKTPDHHNDTGWLTWKLGGRSHGSFARNLQEYLSAFKWKSALKLGETHVSRPDSAQ